MTSKPRTVLVVAGEASGDLHGARLVRAMKQADPSLRVLAVGGHAIAEAGADMLASIEDLAVVGVTEVVQRLPRFWALLRMLKARLSEGDIDLFIPVDFPDFNFRLARHAHAVRVPVFYFIAPQVWAWRRGRLRDLRAWCRHLVVLFPFEVPFFEQAGLEVTHARHPLADGRVPTRSSEAIRAELGVSPTAPLVALLPGSRRSEVSRHMGPLLGAAELLKRRHEGLQVAVGRAPTLTPAWLEAQCRGLPIVDSPAMDLVSASTVTLCASGTATVEVALAGVPMVVLYRVSRITWYVAKRLVSVPQVAMVNLIHGTSLVPELLQEAATPEALAEEVGALLSDPERVARMKRGYERVRIALQGGVDMEVVAERALSVMAR